MDWMQVHDELRSRLLPACNSYALKSDILDTWLRELVNVPDRLGERLAVCILIDLVSGALNPEDLADVLVNANFASAASNEVFAAAVETGIERTCKCRHEPSALVDDAYVRVLIDYRVI